MAGAACAGGVHGIAAAVDGRGRPAAPGAWLTAVAGNRAFGSTVLFRLDRRTSRGAPVCAIRGAVRRVSAEMFSCRAGPVVAGNQAIDRGQRFA